MDDRRWELVRNFTHWLLVPLPGPWLAFGLNYTVFWYFTTKGRFPRMSVPLQTPPRGTKEGRTGPGGHTGPHWLGPGHRSPPWQAPPAKRCHQSSLRCLCKAQPSFESLFWFTRSNCGGMDGWMLRWYKLASSHSGHRSDSGKGPAKSTKCV